MRMLEAVADLNHELRQEEGEAAPVFAVGVGINTGDCVVGNVGSRWRYDYSVLGDTVNLASRLEGLSKEYGVSIILGPDTAEGDRGPSRTLIELDRIAVRGRSDAIGHLHRRRAARAQDAGLAEVGELHPRLLDSYRAPADAPRRCGSIEHCRTWRRPCRHITASLAQAHLHGRRHEADR